MRKPKRRKSKEMNGDMLAHGGIASMKRALKQYEAENPKVKPGKRAFLGFAGK